MYYYPGLFILMSQEISNCSNGSLIIVDDDRRICSTLEMIMSDEKIPVDGVFHSAEDFIRKLDEILSSDRENICVLLDNQMGGITGLEMLEKISSTILSTKVKIRFILFTANGNCPDVLKSVRSNALYRSYLVALMDKPCNLDHILSLVNHLLGKANIFDQFDTEKIEQLDFSCIS